MQHAEYFPSGELWADEVNGSYQQRRPAYLFTGKELDEATGLYYYGARYYDARQGQWLSPDPALAEYAFGAPVGGFYAPKNLWAYTYSWNNPVALRDRDGRIVDTLADIGFIGYDLYRLVKDNAIDRKGNLRENLAALGADVLGAALPFATGLGTVVRVGKATDKIADTVKATDKLVDVVKATDKTGDVAQVTAHTEDAARIVANVDDTVKAVSKAPKPGSTGGPGAGKEFKNKRIREQVFQENTQNHGGNLTCEKCGTGLVREPKSTRGVKPPSNGAQIDHIIARSKGGNNTIDNGQVLCRTCNRDKWDR